MPLAMAMTLLWATVTACDGLPSGQGATAIAHATATSSATSTTAATEPPEPLEDPADILELQGVAKFKTKSRLPVMEENGNWPCVECHDNKELKPNPEVRELDEHEDLVFAHGNGRFWCYACHDSDNRNVLKNAQGQAIKFNQSYLLCGECHFDRQRDFFFGGHGKRVGTWNGERTLMMCTECHEAHNPAIESRQPQPPPKARRGLERPPPPHQVGLPWDRIRARGAPRQERQEHPEHPERQEHPDHQGVTP